jgi:predicted nucleic acid-binding protein
MNYLFDTNIVLLYVTDWKVRQLINSNYKPFKNGNKALLSVVTIGELKSLAQRNQWCLKRVQELKDFLERFIIIDVSSEPLLDAYADIENFSQGKHETRKLKTSARNMGKNDLWIAATTFITKSKLITMDKDFSHLDTVYFDLILMER